MRLHSTQTQFNTNPWKISSFYHSLQYIFFYPVCGYFFSLYNFFWLVSFYLFRYVSLLQALSKILLGIKIGFNLLLTLFNLIVTKLLPYLKDWNFDSMKVYRSFSHALHLILQSSFTLGAGHVIEVCHQENIFFSQDCINSVLTSIIKGTHLVAKQMSIFH